MTSSFQSLKLSLLAAMLGLQILTTLVQGFSPCARGKIGSGSIAFSPSQQWREHNSRWVLSDSSSVGEASKPKQTKEPVAKSIFASIEEKAQNLKQMANKSSAKADIEERKGVKFMLLTKACALYTLFILYRAYRGLFVIMPAVFREVYRKLELAIVDAPFDDSENKDEQNVGKVGWRTRVTVSVLASIVTATYAVSGAGRVFLKLVRTIFSTKDVTSSFAAAVEEQEGNEEKILRLTQKDDETSINGRN